MLVLRMLRDSVRRPNLNQLNDVVACELLRLEREHPEIDMMFCVDLILDAMEYIQDGGEHIEGACEEILIRCDIIEMLILSSLSKSTS